jgi:predicted outer membrane repeat protein
LTVADSTISGNSASDGGGIYSRGMLTILNSTISDNNGGGIYTRDSNLKVIDSTISGNSKDGVGGGIHSRYSSVMISGSTISGNTATYSSGGGGIYSNGALYVIDSTISDNSTGGRGGGIKGSFVTVTNSTVSGNSAGDRGGGISASELIVANSIIRDNSAASGGGIESRSGSVTVTNSTISGNSAVGIGFTRGGGGIVGRSISATNSTISDNSTSDDGGGINGIFVTVANSTISGNSAGGSGGGIFFGDLGNRMLTLSTVTNNEAPDGHGSGVASSGYASPYDSARTEVRSTIIAGNVHSDVDVVNGPTNWFISNGYNLIGTGNAIGTFAETGDQTGVVPLLAPLADNGGPTLTHAPLPGSPAIDAGDPAAVAGMNGVPAFDQRGAPFGRVFDGDGVGGARMDVGAFELPPLPPALLGDYNRDGSVDAADYTLWRDTLIANVTPYSGADGSGNGMVDTADYGVWKSHFGQLLPSHAAVSEATTVRPPSGPVGQLAITASPPSVISGGSAATTLSVGEEPSLPQPVAGANSLPARSAQGASPPTDEFFTLFGRRTPVRSTSAAKRTTLHCAIVDAVVTDTLLLTRVRRDGPMLAENAAHVADATWRDTDTRRERTRNLDEIWRSVVRGSKDLVPVVI